MSNGRSAPQQPTKPEAPFNAGDEEQVADRKRVAKEREDARVKGMRYVMATREGRTYMRHLLEEKLFTRIGASAPRGIFTGNSATFYNTALKEAGDLLAAELNAHCRAEFRLMEDEA